MSKRVSQVVIRRQTKSVAALAFHPSQPIFFVATQQHVRVYNLLQQKLMKKLLTGCKMVSKSKRAKERSVSEQASEGQRSCERARGERAQRSERAKGKERALLRTQGESGGSLATQRIFRVSLVQSIVLSFAFFKFEEDVIFF